MHYVYCSQGLVNNLPVIMSNDPKSSTYWADGYPCALVYECLKSTGYIPSGIKTLIISSAYDAMVFSYGATASAGEYMPFSADINIF
jgi:hypothetical protein